MSSGASWYPALLTDLKTPCGRCPFRSDREPYLSRQKIVEILFGICERGGSFVCHETAEWSRRLGRMKERGRMRHCAGAMIFLEQIKEPNHAMQAGLRNGTYDPALLDGSAHVYSSAWEMLRAHPISKRTSQREAARGD